MSNKTFELVDESGETRFVVKSEVVEVKQLEGKSVIILKNGQKPIYSLMQKDEIDALWKGGRGNYSITRI